MNLKIAMNNNGDTTLHIAAKWNRKEIGQKLLDNNDIQVNKLNNANQTALQVAKCNNKKGIKRKISFFRAR